MSEVQSRRFTDATGQDWTIRVTVGTVRRVKESLAVDLMSAVGGDLWERLIADPGFMVEVLVEVLLPEINKRGITPEDFAEAFSGDAIERATNELVWAIIDFFPNARDRQNLAKIWETVGTAMDRTRDLATERVAKETSPEAVGRLVSQIEQQMDREAAGKQSGSV